MFCPKCGRENPETKNFCPSCGMRLQAIATVMAIEQASNTEANKEMELASKKRKGWQSSLTYSLFVMILGTIISILGKNTFANQAVTDIGTIMAILGIGLIGFNGIARIVKETMPKQKSKTMLWNAATVELPATIQAVEPDSLTEHTTRKLKMSLTGDKKST